MNKDTLYKLVNPEEGEENLVFVVVGYNEGTKRALISPVNSTLILPPTELVLMNQITKI